MNHSKFLLFINLCVSVLFLTSCDRGIKGSGDVVHDQRSVPAFTSVRLKGSFNIYLRKDSVQKVEVVTDDNIAPFVETNVSGGVLEVGIKNGTHIRKSTRSDVFISVTLLESVHLDGSGNISGENTFTGNSIELIISGSGNMNIAYTGSSVKARIDGSGDIQLSGSGDDANLRIDGSGNINAGSFTAKTATAAVNGSGNISVAVTDNLGASVSGSGNINYYGNPSVQSSISGSGNISKK